MYDKLDVQIFPVNNLSLSNCWLCRLSALQYGQLLLRDDFPSIQHYVEQ